MAIKCYAQDALIAENAIERGARMKKLLIVFLAFCLLLCACTIDVSEEDSCQSSSSASEGSTSSKNESSSSLENESSSSLSDNADKAYLDIERFEPKNYEDMHFAIRDSKYVLSVSAPSEWSVVENVDGKCKILRAGAEIGVTLSGGIDDFNDWSIVSEKERDKKTMIISEYVEKKEGSQGTEYRYRWRYSYTEDNESKEINIIVTCPEVPDYFSYRMLTLSSLKEQTTDPNFGIIGELDSPRILIVGNSFVSSSNIGNILQEMLDVNGKNAYVKSISIGMGNIGKYSNDDTVLQEIRIGNYDLVVMSGFYSSDDSASLKIIKDACDEASSILVTFPAHNEEVSSARASSKKCDVKCLEWLTEIDNFISGGVDKWSLCYNDAYYHSTPLAGYIGAHMIYRAIYSQVPTQSPTETISLQEIELLGDYASTGVVNVIDPTLINYLG